MTAAAREKPVKIRGHLLGGLLLLTVGHFVALTRLPGSMQGGWFVYLALVQFVYALPLSYCARRLGWRATWLGIWLGVLFTLLLAALIGVGGWLAQGHKLGFAGW